MRRIFCFLSRFGWIDIGNGLERCVFTGILRRKRLRPGPQKDPSGP